MLEKSSLLPRWSKTTKGRSLNYMSRVNPALQLRNLKHSFSGCQIRSNVKSGFMTVCSNIQTLKILLKFPEVSSQISMRILCE